MADRVSDKWDLSQEDGKTKRMEKVSSGKVQSKECTAC
jgi:hypothetical protein